MGNRRRTLGWSHRFSLWRYLAAEITFGLFLNEVTEVKIPWKTATTKDKICQFIVSCMVGHKVTGSYTSETATIFLRSRRGWVMKSHVGFSLQLLTILFLTSSHFASPAVQPAHSSVSSNISLACWKLMLLTITCWLIITVRSISWSYG
jgi:hypothetical protein